MVGTARCSAKRRSKRAAAWGSHDGPPTSRLLEIATACQPEQLATKVPGGIARTAPRWTLSQSRYGEMPQQRPKRWE